MTRTASVNSDLMCQPRNNMGVLSTLLLPCMQVRKLRRAKRQRDHHSSWSCAGIAELEEKGVVHGHHHPRQNIVEKEAAELSAVSADERAQGGVEGATTTGLSHSKSIRLVSCADSECSTLGPEDGPILEQAVDEGEERDNFLNGTRRNSSSSKPGDHMLSDEETDVEQSSPQPVQKVIAMEVVPSRPPSRAGGGGGDDEAVAMAKAKAQSKDDLDLELASRRIPRNPDRKPRPASMQVQSTGGALKLPEIKSRMIEDIPEDVEGEERRTDGGVKIRPLRQAIASKKAAPALTPAETVKEEGEDDKQDDKRSSTWRLSQRKSMIELFNLLQSTAAAVARMPLVPRSSAFRASTIAVDESPSSVYSTTTNTIITASPAGPRPLRPPTTPTKTTKLPSPPPPTPPPKSPKQLLQQRPLPRTPQRKHKPTSIHHDYPGQQEDSITTPTSPHPSPTKKQRRMGTVLFPLASLRPSGGNAATSPHHHSPHPSQQHNAQTLFC
ncbi:uncharacterized protein BP01DRAFT_379234 [Aspergillus saccharolyticus JOP 1030-1]|uniref:Uncharacterized protein n=1 Tax=Aspergillus saccharolyticus JOP 1030-1 TaxID=1450539 RepID=A0A318ZX02_9EURO|nr:hypothetical protein BP01DRAFT_379234 [Aspergillus saccharolyticus JOP 1030-1]PYH48843.1 hypothetical protein BP01DRAFT_379234 [Aspergillus saccharolyticus JOP 1030-1]